MLEKHLRSVRATLEEEAEKAVKQIRRRPASVQGALNAVGSMAMQLTFVPPFLASCPPYSTQAQRGVA